MTDDLFIAACAQQSAGKLDEAISLFEQLLAKDPAHADASHELGLLKIAKGERDAGLQFLKSSADASHENIRFQLNYALALKQLGRFEESVEPLVRVISAEPQNVDGLKLLGTTLRDLGHLTKSLEVTRRALGVKPEDPPLLNNLALAFQDQGKLDDAIARFRRAIRSWPTFRAAWSNLLLCMNYHDGFTAENLTSVHKNFARQFSPAEVPALRRTPSPDGRIRVGYLSPDFRQHSVAFFIWPILAKHHRDRVRVTCYNDFASPDAITSVLQKLPERWVNVAAMDNDQLAETILRDENDILIELAGHTGKNRMRMLAARRLAPVQVTYLGYPNTTGLPTMDYRITDAVADPPGETEAFHSEKLIRMPDAFFVYIKPGDFPDVAPTPALVRGHVTFAVFTNFPKIRPPMLELWMRILETVPRSRLLIQANSLIDPPTRDELAGKFAARGLADRVTLLEFQHFPQHLQMYKDVDLMLDTSPFNGHTTTCLSLWMGVPVVTLCGSVHRSRMGASVLSNVGLHELIAHTPDEYVQLAAELAGDVERLQQLRGGMRQRVAESRICDDERFASNLEDVFEQMLKDVRVSDTPPAA